MFCGIFKYLKGYVYYFALKQKTKPPKRVDDLHIEGFLFLADNHTEHHTEQCDGFAKTHDHNILREALASFRQSI